MDLDNIRKRGENYSGLNTKNVLRALKINLIEQNLFLHNISIDQFIRPLHIWNIKSIENVLQTWCESLESEALYFFNTVLEIKVNKNHRHDYNQIEDGLCI